MCCPAVLAASQPPAWGFPFPPLDGFGCFFPKLSSRLFTGAIYVLLFPHTPQRFHMRSSFLSGASHFLLVRISCRALSSATLFQLISLCLCLCLCKDLTFAPSGCSPSRCPDLLPQTSLFKSPHTGAAPFLSSSPSAPSPSPASGGLCLFVLFPFIWVLLLKFFMLAEGKQLQLPLDSNSDHKGILYSYKTAWPYQVFWS